MSTAEQAKNWFKECLKNKVLIAKLKKIKLVISDVDGSLTDTKILVTEKEIGKSFSIQDGFATNKAVKNTNLLIAFLSGRKDKATIIRAKMLEIPEDLCFTGEDVNVDKKIKIQLMQKNRKIKPEETLLFGDDFLDVDAKSAVGTFVCPQNTPFYFQDLADVIVPLHGGDSAFRLLLDLILYVQKTHFAHKYIDAALKK
jgi:3-deoxy-D-manno-octulosonate 8-phosphate phosphatase (KDO 8-P phosphatase)